MKMETTLAYRTSRIKKQKTFLGSGKEQELTKEKNMRPMSF